MQMWYLLTGLIILLVLIIINMKCGAEHMSSSVPYDAPYIKKQMYGKLRKIFPYFDLGIYNMKPVSDDTVDVMFKVGKDIQFYRAIFWYDKWMDRWNLVNLFGGKTSQSWE
jgi:hypothetical protein